MKREPMAHLESDKPSRDDFLNLLGLIAFAIVVLALTAVGPS